MSASKPYVTVDLDLSTAKRLLGWAYACQDREDWDDNDEKLLLGLALYVAELERR